MYNKRWTYATIADIAEQCACQLAPSPQLHASCSCLMCASCPITEFRPQTGRAPSSPIAPLRFISWSSATDPHVYLSPFFSKKNSESATGDEEPALKRYGCWAAPPAGARAPQQPKRQKSLLLKAYLP